MEEAVTKQHAHPNTVFHCLYGYYNLGYSKQELAHVYNKTDKTIGNWIKVYERTGTFERARTKGDTKFGATHRQWLLDFYQDRPLAYIDEAQSAFKRAHNMDISKTSVWRIIHDGGLTWKVLERRAMHIKELDILRFMQELSTIDWSHQNIVFLDEVSFDNRGMIRKRGYSLKGTTVAVRGDFQRKPRVSVLAFIGVHGIIDYYDTEGTFDRVKFLESCRAFAYSKRGNVRQYPGSNSVWILDGAAIHRHPEIVHFLRSIGVVPIFLPAYCPFFNPIEYLFGYVKKAFQRHYDESSGRDLTPFIVQTFTLFEGYKMANVFEHCGWSVQGYFNPVGQLAKEISTAADARESRGQMDAHQDELEFSIRQN